MTSLDLLTVLNTIPELKDNELRSLSEANVELDNLPNYPVSNISQIITSTETVRNDGFIETLYNVQVMFLDKCLLDDSYHTKVQKKEILCSLARKFVRKCNKVLQSEGATLIKNFQIIGQIDTSFDANLVCAILILNLPHVDLLQEC